MTESLYKITFTGELMPDADIDTVKDNLARLFKSDRSKIDGLFTGSSVALKRELTEADAEKYLVALQNAGAKVYKEKDLSATLSLVETDDHRTTPLVPEVTTRMTCPKCGHEQATAIECSACGIVIDKYLARQAQLAEEAAANPAPVAAPSALTATLASADARAASPYATPQSQVADGLEEFGELSYVGVKGRIGRVRYLGWYMGMALLSSVAGAILGALGAIAPIIGVVLSFIPAIVTLVFLVFLGGKRLHDIGWSAWLLLLLIIPLVNLILALILLFAPGTKGPNRFGPPPPPNSKGVIVLACVIPFLFVGILAAVAIPAYNTYLERSREASQSQFEQPAAEAVDPAIEAEPSEE